MDWYIYIESETDAGFQEDHGIVEEVQTTSEDNTINAIDCYQHFITNEIISLMVHETNRYAEQYLQPRSLANDHKLFHGNQLLMKTP